MITKMTNDQAPMTNEALISKHELVNRLSLLASRIRISDFFRHWCFVIRHSFLAAALLFALPARSSDPLLLPTSNHALYEPGQEEKFFVPTPGKPWTSGTFGSAMNRSAQPPTCHS